MSTTYITANTALQNPKTTTIWSSLSCKSKDRRKQKPTNWIESHQLEYIEAPFCPHWDKHVSIFFPRLPLQWPSLRLRTLCVIEWGSKAEWFVLMSSLVSNVWLMHHPWVKWRFLTSRPCLNTLMEERGPLPQAAYSWGVSSLAKSAIWKRKKKQNKTKLHTLTKDCLWLCLYTNLDKFNLNASFSIRFGLLFTLKQQFCHRFDLFATGLFKNALQREYIWNNVFQF